MTLITSALLVAALVSGRDVCPSTAKFPVPVILPPSPSASQRYAAEELQKYVGRIVGKKGAAPEIRIVTEESKELGQDGFRIVRKTAADPVEIRGSARRGCLYGAYELLERFGGVRFYSGMYEKVPKAARLDVPAGTDVVSTPDFEMRQPYWFDLSTDPKFAAKLRANGWCHVKTRPTDAVGGDDYRFGGGLPSCHTFERLCPVKQYFDQHPEYYSFVKGKRIKDCTQLCLTNPDVLDIVTSNVLERIRKDPTGRFFGVSQNDWYNYCECDKCRAVDAEEGSHAGTVVRFVNAVAERVEKEFPNAIIETLAYQWSRKPPKKTRLRHNVMPCLCTIECDFAHSLAESKFADNRSFAEDIVGWGRQTDMLYVWDYVTHFPHYPDPFANVLVIQDNIRFFRDHGVKMLFEQGHREGPHGGFAELKAWLMAKWMWDADLPAGPLLDDFFSGYYGAAAPHVRAYFDDIHRLQREWSADGKRPLTIFLSMDKIPYADEKHFAKADAQWAAAEKAVANDPEHAYNVRMGHFSHRYVKLESMRARAKDDALATNAVAVALARELLADRAAAKKPIVLKEWGDAERVAAWKKIATGSAKRKVGVAGAKTKIVSFKDAAKIKSWDAWDDNGAMPTVTKFNERPSVTRAKLLKMKSGLRPWGELETRRPKAIASEYWSVGCETLDRDYADWDQYKFLLGELGAKRARFFSGWAKTEQEKGKYDFSWLDRQLRECAAMGVKPWVCISYGNPVWGSDFRLGMRVSQVTDDPEAFAAWIRYVKALVAKCGDIVDEWEIWNEPFGQGREYAEMVYATAKAVREVQPKATCIVTAVGWDDDVKVLEKLKKEKALDLVKYWVDHPYYKNPDETYPGTLRLRKLVKSYSPDYDVIQGEVGCPSQLEFSHALNGIEWTEYAQAKWDLRRALGDYVRGIRSNLFTFIDLQYTFMLQSFGLVRSNTLKEPVYRRPSYFAMQNVYSFFDENVHPVSIVKKTVNGKELTIAKFEIRSMDVFAVWFSGERPGDSLHYELADLEGLVKGDAWCDLMTGRICHLDSLAVTPVWDSPILITSGWALPRKTDWAKMTPAEIVDAIYCPQLGLRPSWINGVNMKMDVTKEPWAKMKTEEFLPCFDRYGQFKWRTWPGKTRTDAEMKSVAAEEEKDLAAHPGPKGWTKFGGWEAGPKFAATGRFYPKKVDGKWWLVDPEGRLFWSWGPVRVTPSSAVTPLNGNPRCICVGGAFPSRDCLFEDLPKKGDPLAAFYDTYDALLLPFYLKRGETRRYDFSSANLYRKYGEKWFEKFSDSCHRRLRSWGCNTIANSSDLRICLQDRTPYAERVECLSRPIAGSNGQWAKFRDPFDPSFTEGVKKALGEHGREAHDPWCIGFFVDNEINWGRNDCDLARWTLWSPDDQPAKVAFAQRLAAKGIDYRRDAVPDAELKAFTAVLVEEYFKRTRAAVKDFDKGLLYLGCRFAGWAPPWVIAACARHCDVVSYNIYALEIAKWKLPQNLDAPVMVGEFHFGAHDRGLFGSGLCNMGSQKGRAAQLKKYVESALGNPQIVGVHWHQFSDQPTSGRFDGEYFQVGWTDVCDRPYRETVDALRSIDLYATREK